MSILAILSWELVRTTGHGHGIAYGTARARSHQASLFPDDAVSSTYAVSDTQFAMDEWLPGHPIP